MTVNVLGRAYELLEGHPETDPVLKDNDGYCDPSVAVCVIAELDKRETDSLKDMDAYKRRVMRWSTGWRGSSRSWLRPSRQRDAWNRKELTNDAGQ